jgi:hypothetical protein
LTSGHYFTTFGARTIDEIGVVDGAPPTELVTATAPPPDRPRKTHDDNVVHTRVLTAVTDAGSVELCDQDAPPSLLAKRTAGPDDGDVPTASHDPLFAHDSVKRYAVPEGRATDVHCAPPSVVRTM